MPAKQEIKRIAVIGAGAMGAGSAQVAASAGFEVVLRDLKTETLECVAGAIRKSVERMGKETVVCKDAQAFSTSRALCALLIEAGHYRRKTGRGFYDYSQKDAATLKG